MAETVTGQWTKVVEHAEFSPRDTAEDAVFAGRLWLSNAYNTAGKLTRDLWSSQDGRSWTKVLDETPYDGYSEFAVFRDKLWAIKGSVWNSADGEHWTKVLDKTPFGQRSYGEVVVFQDQLWQLGSGPDVWRSADGVTWTQVVAKAPWGNRWGPAVAVYGGRLWLCGGATQEASEPPEKHYPKLTTHNDVWSSTDGLTWTKVLDHAPWAARQWFIGREYAGRLWVIGGFSNRNSVNFAEAWCTTDGAKWDKVVSEPMWTPRHEPTVYVWDGSLWVVGGNMWPLMNDVWKLTAPAP